MITLGTDPELFFTVGEEVLPAKVVFEEDGVDNPYPTMAGDIIIDGVALELNPEPASSGAELADNVRTMLAKTIELFPTRKLVMNAEMPIDLEWCKKDASIAIFGCDPDFSVWGEDCEPACIDASQHPWRYAGCHMHFATDSVKFMKNRIPLYAKALDRTQGLASFAIGNNLDHKRREVYGRPGVCRVQKWWASAFEYRTPSIIALRHPVIFSWFSHIGKMVVEMADDTIESMKDVIPDDLLLNALRTGSASQCKELYHEVALALGLPLIPEVEDKGWVKNWEIR